MASKKKYTPKYKAKRLDMRKGGQVRKQYAVGGPNEDGMKRYPQDEMSIRLPGGKKPIIGVPKPVDKTPDGYADTPKSIVDNSIGATQTGPTFKVTPWNITDTDAPTDSTTTTATGPKGPVIGINNINNPPDDSGDWVWDDEQGEWMYTGDGTPGSNVTTTTVNKGEGDPYRDDRVVRTGQTAEETAAGRQSPDLPQVPMAKKIGRAGTEIDIKDDRYRMTSPEDAGARGVGPFGTEVVTTKDASTASLQDERGVSKVGRDQLRTLGDEEINLTAAERDARGMGPAEQQTLTDTRDNAAITRTLAKLDKAPTVEALISGEAFVPNILDGYQASQVNITPDAEKQIRNAIVDNSNIDRNAAAIAENALSIINYDAITQTRKLTGEAAKGSAVTMIAETAAIPQDIAAAIVEDPATVEAQIDNEPVEIQAAVAALPAEALVSSQMESLLAGVETGEVPIWARPAIDAIDARMVSRGLEASTIARVPLLNAIIQSTLPIAQSNAQALQARAAQNLSNQQQVNLSKANNEQQIRLANLANRQGAATQTAQMSQQMRGMQSQFAQQAILTGEQQQQQTALQNLENRQQAALIESQNAQAIASQELGNAQQINLAELQIEAQQEGANQSAQNQQKLVEYQTAADFLSKNAGFKQQMDLANLSEENKIRLANLSARNQADADQLNSNERIELANLNKRLQVNTRNAELAQQMGVAQLNVDQQRAMQNAQMVSNMDMTKFTTAQQVELANSKWMQSTTMANMNSEQQSIIQEATSLAQLDVANLSVRERVQVENAKNFLQYDMANLNNDQQARVLKTQLQQQRLLSDQSAQNAAVQFNATSENQVNQFMQQLGANMEQYNASAQNNMKQFNATSNNSAEARRVGNNLQAASLDAQLATDVSKFNADKEFIRDQFNAQQNTVIAQSTVDWRRKANTADTAAFNAVNQQNAQNAFNLSASANNFLWQELRDEADFDFKRWDNDQQRKTSLLVAALGNEQGVNEKGKWDDNISALYNLFSAWVD